MNIVRTSQSRQMIEDALVSSNGDPLENASFMLTKKQIALLKQLARENRYMNSQGAILRYIIDDWMRVQLEEGVDGQ